MAADELSPRALRLTELVISLNPAHYTVWLYRFKIVSHLNLSIPDEITWLNEVALDNLKNYQIWHHRQLLLDRYVPSIQSDAAAMKALARSETDFISTMLQEDTKNYHVWTYRQQLVKRLGMWGPAELGSAQNLIEEDVRNNSAWSHRFFLVFSNPDASTPDIGPTERDARVPEATIDREAGYAKEKIALAPQNQSGWNYLRGVLVKGGRNLGSEEGFAAQFVKSVGEEGEEVRSSHALDFLAEVFQEKSDKDSARLYLQRLAQKWDPIREGYWNYRAAQLE
jgi:protein farnesyltransferase/geranylgeranyltransferase type-1 subunit alpha